MMSKSKLLCQIYVCMYMCMEEMNQKEDNENRGDPQREGRGKRAMLYIVLKVEQWVVVTRKGTSKWQEQV